MDHVTLKNYRCFREEQTVRLAPLTLLVGENSSGKTSFLAMLRVLWDAAYRFEAPDFREEPYDLGSFNEIAHHRGGRGRRATTFEASFRSTYQGQRNRPAAKPEPFTFGITFGKHGTVPVPIRRYSVGEGIGIHEDIAPDRPWRLRTKTADGEWELKAKSWPHDSDSFLLGWLPHWLFLVAESETEFVPVGESPEFTKADRSNLREFAEAVRMERLRFRDGQRVFASAPVRSKPSRTYDPSRPTRDPEGDYVPMYLASVYSQNKKKWSTLRRHLESFGKEAGLFDEISIKMLEHKDTGPFQVQVRKFGGKLKGPKRNVIDMGYGVSQVLPLITELLRKKAPPIFLLQQPEVHLHPSAQAALGTLFCQIASRGRQLIVETHSDHLLDRVRMDVRDGRGILKSNDISILFFERRGLDVCIHSLQLDAQGNVLGAPGNYRRFFMEETRRSIGL